jgi:hypothetical protein
VGTPICTDQLTNKPRFEREFGHFARVLVDMDLKKEPLYRVLVERTGFAFFVDFEFENMPEYCHFCNTIGHNQSYCKKIVPDKKKMDKEGHLKAPQQTQKKEYRVLKSNKKDIVTDHVVEVVNLEHSPTPKVMEVDPILEGLLKNNEDPTTHAADTVLTPPEHDVVPPLVHDNDDVDMGSSSDSEFVDATQPDFNNVGVNVNRNNDLQTDSPAEVGSSEKSSESVTPVRIAQDMAFLKNSWANLADQESDDYFDQELDGDIVRKLNTPAEETADVPFQVVTNKRNRKKKHVASNTYSTRSKVGQPSGGS